MSSTVPSRGELPRAAGPPGTVGSAVRRRALTAWSAMILELRCFEQLWHVRRCRHDLEQIRLECGRVAAGTTVTRPSHPEQAALGARAARLLAGIQRDEAEARKLADDLRLIDRKHEPEGARALAGEIRALNGRIRAGNRELTLLHRELGTLVLAAAGPAFNVIRQRAGVAEAAMEAAEAGLEELRRRRGDLNASLGVNVRWLVGGALVLALAGVLTVLFTILGGSSAAENDPAPPANPRVVRTAPPPGLSPEAGGGSGVSSSLQPAYPRPSASPAVPNAQATIRYFNRLVEVDQTPPVTTPTLMRRVATNIVEIPADDGVDPDLLEYAKQRAHLYGDYATAFEQGDYFTTFTLVTDFSTRPGLAELKEQLVEKYHITFVQR